VADISYPKKQQLNKAILQVYMLLTFLGGIFTLISILRIPGEPGSAILFGLSRARLVLFSAVLIVTLAAAWLLIRSRINQVWFSTFSYKLNNWLGSDKVYGAVLVISIFVFLNGWNFVTLLPGITEPVTQAYYFRLGPVMSWSLILCGQTILGISLVRFGFDPPALRKWGRKIYSTIVTISLILILWLWVSGTGYGLDPIDEGIGWHVLGPPILGTQVILAWGISIGLLSIWIWLSAHSKKSRWVQIIQKDAVICILLWITAFSLWMSQPLKPNWFLSAPRPPNFEFYPNSDASVYDISAINLISGSGFTTRGIPFTLRPLYALFLAGLHTVGGLSYEPIIWMQVAVLSLIPVIIFLLTKRYHKRVSGILAALLMILRERNAIALGDSISDAYVKLLLPFLPTTLGVLLFIWAFSTWLQNPSKRPSLPLISGGIMGIFMLIRPEFGFLLPVVGLAAILQLRKNPGVWVRGMVLITTGLVLSLAPWIWRNYQLTGTIFIDSPHYRLDLFTRRYRDDPIGFVLPAETPGKPEILVPSITGDPIESEKPSDDPETAQMVEDVIGFAIENPGTTTNFILSHLMNSTVQTVLSLPPSYPITYSAISFLGHKSMDQFWLACCSLTDYERRLPFWPKWDGVLPLDSIVPLTINLLLIAVGISMTWKRQKFMGLIPLFAAFGYFLVNAIVRNSGGRYIIPLNWIGIFYFSIGLIQVTIWGISFFWAKSSTDEILGETQTRGESLTAPILRLSNLGIAAGIFVLGCTLPILERAIPRNFDETTLSTRILPLMQPDNSLLNDEEIDRLESFIKNNGIPLTGLALYPRFHKPYQMGSVWNIYHDRPFSHMDFYLTSPHNTGIVLPLDEPPINFPHGSNVLVFACPQIEDFEALAVILYSDDGIPVEVLWRSPQPETLACPFPSPQ
jgi:hypothetical protein